jgi:Uma2 family endonuclease
MVVAQSVKQRSESEGDLLNLIARAASLHGLIPERMTFEQFIEWCTEETLAEWVDGEVFSMTAPGKAHQNLSGFLYALIRLFLELHRLGEVISAPFKMKLPSRPSGRQPDLMFVKTEHLGRFNDSFLDGPADLVVEVTSSSTIGVDRGDKFYEYETACIPEYWLIDADRQRAEFYQLGEGGVYHLVLSGKEGVYISKVLTGFVLRVEWLWQQPGVAEVLRAMESHE